jgi:TonB family protein
MSEETWYKMLAVSFALHILVVGAFSITFKSKSRRIDLSSSYSVNLVGGPGGGGGGAVQKEAARPETKKIPEKPTPAVKETKPAPVKNKPIPIKKEDLVSLSKKKVPEKKETTEEEFEQVQKKIQNLKKKTEYLDVAKVARGVGGVGSGGFLGTGEGGGGIVDPLLQKYHMDVVEKIKEAWRKPVFSKRGVSEVVIAVRIRRDGTVVDINPEKTSGNRLYDESVIRAIKAAEPLPRVPAGIKDDPVDLGFTFRPEDM